MFFKKALIIIVFSFAASLIVKGQYKVYNFDTFEKFLHANDEKVYVINFWATWCKPCVEEMPAFNTLHKKYNTKNIEIILVSLDFGKNVQERITEFQNLHEIQSRIIILDDPDSNSWINKVNSDWSGALPATIIYSKDKRVFYERTFTFNELETQVLKFL